MTTVLLVIHIMIALALIAVVLLQRSEGGALGIGGGGGGFMTGRSAGNALRVVRSRHPSTSSACCATLAARPSWRAWKSPARSPICTPHAPRYATVRGLLKMFDEPELLEKVSRNELHVLQNAEIPFEA